MLVTYLKISTRPHGAEHWAQLPLDASCLTKGVCSISETISGDWYVEVQALLEYRSSMNGNQTRHFSSVGLKSTVLGAGHGEISLHTGVPPTYAANP